MSSQPKETFNLNLLQDAPAEGLSGEHPSSVDGADFAAQLAGGGGAEFIIPTEKKGISKATIGCAVVVALAAGGLWWMKERTGGPSPAEAAEPGVVAARESIQQFLATGSGTVSEMKSMLADSESITEKFSTFSESHQVPLESLKTNPFYMDLEDEPAPAPRDLSRTREAERARIELERLTNLAAKLNVQTIFYGRRPTAMIDGKICQPGQQLGEFMIVAIHADWVELSAGEHRFEVKLKR